MTALRISPLLYPVSSGSDPCRLLSPQERDLELTKEAQRQEENDKLRKEFAKHANTFHQWLTETRWVLRLVLIVTVL